MAVVPLQQVWIDANFKESQLAKMRIGQPVELTADIYGDKVEYSGRIAGLAAGTGSAFSLLPAQNATGNWIKVVQRLPVRVEIDPEQLQKHPLRIGLSMLVDVNITEQTGLQLSSESRKQPAWQTAVYVNDSREADARVQEIINANAGSTHKLAASSTRKSMDGAARKTAGGKSRAQLARNSR
jgi:membrane fusion protein (multidrug efflux system)